jgi:hypothetical protein
MCEWLDHLAAENTGGVLCRSVANQYFRSHCRIATTDATQAMQAC